MKVTLKVALLGAALIGSVASAANVNSLTTSPNGSNLVLLMKNYTDGTYFVEEINNTAVAGFNSIATLQSAGAGQYSLDGTGLPGSLTVAAPLNGYTSANAGAFLQANQGDNIVWTLMGGYAGAGTLNTGDQSVVFTSPDNYLAESRYVSAGDPATAAAGINSLIQNEINPAVYTNGVSNTNGYDSSNVYGMNAEITFIGNNAPNGAAVGHVAVHLPARDLGRRPRCQRLQVGGSTLSLGLNGTFSYTGADLAGGTAPVPVPAAVWLLGSGLVSLVGVARRRKLGVVAQAA